MRATLTTLLVLVLAAPAAARPLDDDRGFARNGIFLREQPGASYAAIALSDGGTLHATYDGLMRLSARGEAVEPPRLEPPGAPSALLPGLAVGVATPVVYGEPLRLGVWRLGPDGTALGHHAIAAPDGLGARALQVVRRANGYAVLLSVHGKSESYSERRMIAALTADGALDETWGDGGFRATGSGSPAIGGGRDGTLVVATDVSAGCKINRKVRPVLRVQRLDATGAPATARRHVLGPRGECESVHPGELRVDGRGRVTLAAGFGPGGGLVRLTKRLRRDRRFGRNGVARVTSRPVWWLPMALEPRRGGGFGVGYTTVDDVDRPHAHAALLDARGRRVRTRRLRVTRSHPTSDLYDIAFDRRGGLVAAGALRDTDTYIREDYGQPHLAVWRLRRR